MTVQAAGAGGAGAGGSGQGSGAGSGAGTQSGSSILSAGQSGTAGQSGEQGAGAGAGQGQGSGAAASAAGGAGAGQGAGNQPQPWAWSEGVAGTGDRPAWFKGDKFKTVDKQAEAYAGLEAKLGPAAELIGAPEGDYAVPALPQGMQGEVNADDPLLKGFSVAAKKLGLSQKAYESVVNDMRGVILQMNNAEQAALADSLASLGQNVPQRVAAVQTYVTSTLGQPAFQALDDAIGTNAEAFKALESLVAKASGDAQLANLRGNQSAGISKADIEAEQYKVFPEGHKLKGKRMYDHDQEHRKKVDAMWKKLYPGEDRQEVG